MSLARAAARNNTLFTPRPVTSASYQAQYKHSESRKEPLELPRFLYVNSITYVEFIEQLKSANPQRIDLERHDIDEALQAKMDELLGPKYAPTNKGAETTTDRKGGAYGAQ